MRRDRVGGNAEALQEGKSGYLVASEDSEAMADVFSGSSETQ